jgi:hypothetical protein
LVERVKKGTTPSDPIKLKNYSSFYFNTKSHYLKLCLVSIKLIHR